MTAPLEDPAYVPKHPPENGYIPWVVEKWGARSQLRWFERFWHELRSTGLTSFWEPYFIDSVLHRGRCCSSCIGDYEDGYDSPYDGHCCCLAPTDDRRTLLPMPTSELDDAPKFDGLA